MEKSKLVNGPASVTAVAKTQSSLQTVQCKVNVLQDRLSHFDVNVQNTAGTKHSADGLSKPSSCSALR